MFTQSGAKEKQNYSDFSTWYQCTTIFQLSVLTFWPKFFVKKELRFTILNVCFCFLNQQYPNMYITKLHILSVPVSCTNTR